MRKNFRETKPFPPYTGKNYTLKTKGGCGVYIIRRNGVITYIGKSHTDLRGTLYRHFQQWIDKRSQAARKYQIYARVTYYGQPREFFSAQVIYTPTPAEADCLEMLLVFKHRPQDNTQKLDFFILAKKLGVNKHYANAREWKPYSEEMPF